MAVNLATKYSSKVDERFKLGPVTNGAVNNDYEFSGVNVVKVYSIPTADMNDYARTGTGRYGTPSELQDSLQTLTLSKDRSFTFTIDRGNNDEQMMVKNAGIALRRQIDEVVIPELDVYRLGVMATNAANEGNTPFTSSNAYEVFLDGQNALTEKKVPQTGRIAFVSPKFYKAIKLDDAFIKAGDLSQEMVKTGAIGMVDGVAIYNIPQSYFATNVHLIITHPVATVSPVTLSDYKVHDNPPGINGWLVEGRIIFDAFVLDNKKGAIYKNVQALGSLTLASVAGTASGDTKITVDKGLQAGTVWVQKSGASQALPTWDQDLSSWTAWDGTSDITATTGHKLVVAEVDEVTKKARKAGLVTVVSKA